MSTLSRRLTAAIAAVALGALPPVVVQAAAAGSAANDSLEEVIVTAQKREERLIDVPMAITEVSAVELSEQNLDQMSQYYSRIPSLQYAGNKTYNLSLRGVTTGNATNPTLAILIDDVQFGGTTTLGLGNSRFPDFDPSTLQSIEVLRGPQGTLYGAASLGGLIKYVTRKPDTHEFSGRAEAGMSTVQGGDTGYSVRGSVNIPIASDVAAIRVSGFSRRDPPYLDNVRVGNEAENINKDRTYGGQAALLLTPTEKLSITLSALRQERRGYFDSGIRVLTDSNGVPTYVPQYGQTAVSLAATSDIGTQQQYSGRIEYDFGPVQLTSLTAWNKSEGTNFQDLTAIFGFLAGFYEAPEGSTITIDDAAVSKKFSQELRLSGSNEKLEWRAGVFYTKEEGNVLQTLTLFDPTGGLIAVPYVGEGPLDYREHAFFGDMTVHATDKLDIQFGARYARNFQTYNSMQTVDENNPIIPLVFGPSGSIGTFPSSDNAFTWAISPSFHFNPDLMGYARLATGYRPGGPNTGVGSIPLTYGSDKVFQVEVGAKGTLADSKVTFDVALFMIDWKNIQLQDTDAATQFVFFTNGGGASSNGLEIAAGWRPIEGLTIEGNVTLLDATLTETLPLSADADTLLGRNGDRLPASAKFSGNLSAQYDFNLSGALDAFVGATWTYVGTRKSAFQSSAATRPRFDLPHYASMDLRAGMNYDKVWHLNLFARNLFNKEGVVTADNRNGTSSTTVRFLQPRTIGLSLARDF